MQWRSDVRSLASFVVYVNDLSLFARMNSRIPLLLRGSCRNWPAFRLWRDPDYILSTCGHRTVPVELGSSYLDGNWQQNLMTMENFFKIDAAHDDDKSSYMGNTTEQRRQVLYLAQHPLFDQIPAMRKDILTPDFCFLPASRVNVNDSGVNTDVRSSKFVDEHSVYGKNQDGEHFVLVHAWLGPAGTVSPIHFDVYDNVLSQVVGYKYVRLFDPGQTERLYPHENGPFTNAAKVDINHQCGHNISENVKRLDSKLQSFGYDKYPKYKDALYSDIILEPGDQLFIPSKYWHYVQSVTPSFSVSHWW